MRNTHRIIDLKSLLITILLVSCGGDDLNKITFLSQTAAIFSLQINEETPIEEGTFVWIENSVVDDNAQLLLEDFNIARGDISNIVPEEVELTILNDTTNWRAIRTVQLYVYDEAETDSLLIARLDTIPTTINEVLTLNPNTESLRPYLLNNDADNDFKIKTLLETRAQISVGYNFELTAINRVNGEI